MSGFVLVFFTFVYGNMFIILFALTTFNSFILNTEFLPKVMKTNIFFLFKIINTCMLTLEFLK